MGVSQIDLWIVGAYLVATLVIGLYFGSKLESFEDFAIGNRKIGLMGLVATMFATITGADRVLVTSEKVFAVGIVFILVTFGNSISHTLEGFAFKRMDRCLESSLSPGDIIGYFYGRAGKFISGLAIVVVTTGFLGLQVKATGYLFEYFLRMTPMQGIFLGAGLVVFYSSLGGIRAVTATDILQFAMLAIALPFLALWTLWQVGGPEVVKQGLPAGHLNFFFHGPNAKEHISLFALYCFPMMYAIMLQRLLMAKNAKQGARALWITAGVGIVLYCVAGAIGLIATAANAGLEARLALPWVIQQYTSPGIYGMMVVGLLAVIMSSADSYLHVASIAMTHDVIGILRTKKLDSKAELRLAQVASLIIGSLAMCVALWFNDLLSIAVAFRFFWALAMPIPLIAAVYGFRASPRTFLLAVAAGVATSLSWKWFAPANAIGPFVPSILVHSIVFFAARMFDPLHIRVEKKGDGTTVVEAGREPISTLSSLDAQRHAWRYFLFAMYMLFLYMMPMGFATARDYRLLTATGFFMSAAVCFTALPSLFAQDYSPWLQRCMPAYWKAALTICLPLASTFMLLHEPHHLRWVFSAPVCIFLLSIMLPWRQYVVSLPAGAVLGTALAALLGEPNTLSTTFSQLPLWLWPNLVGVGVVGFVSAYYMQTLEEKVLEVVRFGFSQSVHDGLTSAAAIQSYSDTIKDHLPDLLKAYDKARKARLDVKAMDPEIEKAMREMPEALFDCAGGNLSYWTMLLHNTRGRQRKLKLRAYWMSELVHRALGMFPFASEEERKLVTVEVKKDMLVLMDEPQARVLVHNLVNNATYFMRQKPGSRMRVTINADDNGGRPGMGGVRFWDGGPGMTDEVAKHAFVPRFSTREGGSGWGLPSMHQIVEAHKGLVRLRTKEGEFTEIIIYLPLHKEGDPIPQEKEAPSAGHSSIRRLRNELKGVTARQEQLRQLHEEIQKRLAACQQGTQERAELEQNLQDAQELQERAVEERQEILEELEEEKKRINGGL
ncbi:MAG: ATP-binding protein [Myxococcota bacterium]